jgi:hypothetical protein
MAAVAMAQILRRRFDDENSPIHCFASVVTSLWFLCIVCHRRRKTLRRRFESASDQYSADERKLFQAWHFSWHSEFQCLKVSLKPRGIFPLENFGFFEQFPIVRYLYVRAQSGSPVIPTSRFPTARACSTMRTRPS